MLTDGASVVISARTRGSSAICPTSFMKMRKVRSELPGFEPKLALDGIADLAQRLPNRSGQRLGASVGAMPSLVRTNSGSSSNSRKPVELLAHGGLGQVQIGGRGGDAASLQYGVEHPQQVQVEVY